MKLTRPIRKILIVTDTWSETNGVATTLRHTVAMAERLGVEVVMLHPGPFPRFVNPYYPLYRPAIPMPRRVRSILRSAQPDAVHIVTEGPLGIVARRQLLNFGWQFTSSFHTRWDEHCTYTLSLPSEWGWRYVRWFHQYSSHLLVPTPSIMRLLQVQGITSTQKLWQRGIHAENFYPRPKQHHHVTRPIMLYVGRVSNEKNLPAFLELQHPGTKYVVGDGPLLAKLRETYRVEVEAGRIVFFGERKGDALASLYAEADVFVFPSLTDTFGNVILEALSSGVPVAALPAPGPMDILGVQGVGALHADLAVAVREALATGSKEACLTHAATYTWEAATKQFLAAVVPIDSTTASVPTDSVVNA